MSLREIGRLFGYDHSSVLMYVNVFKLPIEYQEAVWNGDIPIGNIRVLRALFNGDQSPTKITDLLDQRLSTPELEKVINPTLTKFQV